MSSHSDPIDYISFSPSLLHILSFIDYDSISNVQLVSRKFHEIINNNKSQMQRPVAVLSFTLSLHKKQPGQFFILFRLSVFGSRIPQTAICITDECIRVSMGTRKELTDYLDDNATLYTDQLPSKERYVLDKIKDNFLGDAGTENVKDYVSGGIETELSRLMQFIMRKYNLHQLIIYNRHTLSNSRESHWFEIIANTARKSRIKCEYMDVMRAWPGLEDLYSSLGCRKIYVRSLSPEVTFVNFVANENNFYRRTSLSIGGEFFDSLDPIISFIKIWEMGQIRIPSFNVGGYRSKRPYRWSHSEFLAEFEKCFHIVSSNTVYMNVDTVGHMEIVLKRSTDNVVLCLAYSQVNSRLYMADVVSEGSTPDVPDVTRYSYKY